MKPRYYIDERIGCIAIIDTSHPDYDPERNGVEQGTNGCVWYEHGVQARVKCPTCGYSHTGAWSITDGQRERATAELARLTASEPGAGEGE